MRLLLVVLPYFGLIITYVLTLGEVFHREAGADLPTSGPSNWQRRLSLPVFTVGLLSLSSIARSGLKTDQVILLSVSAAVCIVMGATVIQLKSDEFDKWYSTVAFYVIAVGQRRTILKWTIVTILVIVLVINVAVARTVTGLPECVDCEIGEGAISANKS